MSPLYPTNDWSDINLYFTIGKSAFNGKVIYSDLFDHKGPLIFVIYGIGYLISNTSFLGMYFILSMLWALMAISSYLSARLYLDRIYAFIVATVFPVFMLTHTQQGGSAEEFISIFSIISLYLFISYFKEKDAGQHNPNNMLIHGLLFACAVFIKINLAVFWFFPVSAIFISLLKNKEYKNVLVNLGTFILGCSIITLPFILYFYKNNALIEAWDIYINLNRNYAKMGGFSETVERIIVSFYLRLRYDTFPFLIILLGAIYFPLNYLKNTFGKISIILSFFAIFAVIFVNTNFIYYYSIPYYIYGLMGFIAISKFLRIKEKWYIYALCFILSLYWGISKKNLYDFEINELVSRNFQTSPTNTFKQIIEKEDHPSLMSLALDEENVLFTQLNIFPDIKYFIAPNLIYEGYPELRDSQTRYIENKEIQFIVLSERALYFDYFHSLPALNNNYCLVESYEHQTGIKFYLYKRKE